MPIGPSHEITDCQANILIELDGRPALDVFKEGRVGGRRALP